MKIQDVEYENLEEGVFDPHIFKAVFMAGSPGSGKSTVARKLFAHTGLRTVDVDKFQEMFIKLGRVQPGQDIPRQPLRDLAGKQIKNFLQGRLGLMLDGTARYLDAIAQTQQELASLGYDMAMVFVNTDLDTSLARAHARGLRTGRVIAPHDIQEYWYKVQGNLGHLQSMFGRRFYLVDNSGGKPNLSYVQPALARWLSQPPHDPVARKWIHDQLQARRAATAMPHLELATNSQ
jgi:adenylate kinase family enzyme